MMSTLPLVSRVTPTRTRRECATICHMVRQTATATDDPPEVIERNGGQLRPFTKATAAAAGRRSAEVRKAKRAAQRADSLEVLRALRTLSEQVERDDLAPIAIAAALDMIGRVQRGEQVVKDPAEWVRVLVDVARLESGEATSTSIVAHIGTTELQQLRDEARKAVALPMPEPVALAAADTD